MSCACRRFGFPANIEPKNDTFTFETIFSLVASYSDLVVNTDHFISADLYNQITVNRAQEGKYMSQTPKSLTLSSGAALTKASVLVY
jgi:hypothetical protein